MLVDLLLPWEAMLLPPFLKGGSLLAYLLLP